MVVIKDGFCGNHNKNKNGTLNVYKAPLTKNGSSVLLGTHQHCKVFLSELFYVAICVWFGMQYSINEIFSFDLHLMRKLMHAIIRENWVQYFFSFTLPIFFFTNCLHILRTNVKTETLPEKNQCLKSMPEVCTLHPT